MLRRVVDDLREQTRRRHRALAALTLQASNVTALNAWSNRD
jgi:hypothetical protein